METRNGRISHIAGSCRVRREKTNMNKSLFLNRSQVAGLLDNAELLESLKAAFRGYSKEKSTMRARRFPILLPPPAPPDAGAMILAPGLIPGIPAYTLKCHAKFPASTPAIHGLLLLHDLENGHLLALMDSTHVTACRTGMAGTLGAAVLARPESASVAIIGAGAQGDMNLKGLQHSFDLRRGWVYDRIFERSEAFCRRHGKKSGKGGGGKGRGGGIDLQPASTVEEAVREADIVVAATWSREPFLYSHMIAPGTHITTLGPDQAGKCEVDGELILKSLFVCDDSDLTLQMGALQAAGLGVEALHAELGDILNGSRPGRTGPEQITIFGSVGLAFQDLAAAWQVYEKALAAGVGTHLDILA